MKRTNAEERKLIEALRSDHYEQGKDALRIGAKFCCLGVYCDISPTGKWSQPTGEDFLFTIKGESSESVLPRLLQRRLNWSSDSGTLILESRGGDVITLAHLNDNGMPFSQIADIIEAGLVKKAPKKKK